MVCPIWCVLIDLNILMFRVSPSPNTADVLSEEAILKWYAEAHVAKGKSVFLEQMKKFVEWLKNAEEGKKKQRLIVPFLKMILIFMLL